MNASGRWFRVNTTWSDSDWIAALPPASRLAWIELLGYVKAHGIDGRVRSMTADGFGRKYNIPIRAVSALLTAAVKDEALKIDDNHWIITGWEEHQGDPTAADRNRRYRERKRAVTPVTRNEVADTRNVTPVTATETETVVKDTNVSLSGSDEPNADRASEAAEVRQVFDYWRTRCGHEAATLTKDRRAKIRARLKVFSAKQLEAAIEGARASPFHQGENDRHTRYDWLETIFKTDSSAEKLMLANQNGVHGKPKFAPIIEDD